MSDPLSNAGWVVFVSGGCHYCKSQKDLLQQTFPNFSSVIDNDKGYARAVPTWVNTKTHQVVAGFQPVESLRRMAGM